jgi:uncharacterized delta-60 repeat protein
MSRIVYYLLLVLVLLGSGELAAQTRRDPSFTPQALWQPTALEQALQLSDGSRILVGRFNRVNGQTGIEGCVKFTPGGQLDAAFNTHLAGWGAQVLAVAEAPGNKLLLAISDSVSLGGQYRKGLVRLLSDGSYDASFTSLPGSLYYSYYGINGGVIMAVQANGRVLLGGELAVAAQGAAANPLPLVRLLDNGLPDMGFATLVRPIFPASTANRIGAILLQPDGKVLIGGALLINSGQGQPPIMRLLSTGARDATFSANGLSGYFQAMTLQADGKVLVALEASWSAQQLLQRLLANGSIDPSFNAPMLMVSGDYRVNNSVIQVQPDGRILVAGASPVQDRDYPLYTEQPTQFVSRLLPTGQPDISWQPAITGNDHQATVQSVQLLPGGQVLIAGQPRVYGPIATALPTAVGVLDGTGAYLPGFAPLLQHYGEVRAMVPQPDGRIVVAGSFSEINGQPARNLARLLPDGSLDAAVTANAMVRGGNSLIEEMVLQPDGRIVVAGGFATVGGLPRAGVARLLATGMPDTGFTPTLDPNSSTHVGNIHHLAVQPDGQVLISGRFRAAGSTQLQLLVRLTTTGAVDASFLPPPIASTNSIYDIPLLVRPDGRIITANVGLRGTSNTLETVNQLLPTGSLDPGFTPPAISVGPANVYKLAVFPDGRLALAGSFYRFGGWQTRNLAVLQPTGAVDASFASAINLLPFSMVLQANGRILAAGGIYFNSPVSIVRVLPTGAIDASLDAAALPLPDNYASVVAVQADGGILAAGYFAAATGGQPAVQVVRLLDSSVLAGAVTDVWPVPAQSELHVRVDMAAGPKRLQLFDAMGREVLRESVSQPETTLATAALAAGVYLLRVDYAAGPVTRRVVVVE